MNELKKNGTAREVASDLIDKEFKGVGGSSISTSPMDRERLGQIVLDLLDKQTGNTWKYDLWSIMEGNIAHQADTDTKFRSLDEFLTFRDLVFFFEDIEALRDGKEVKRP